MAQSKMILEICKNPMDLIIHIGQIKGGYCFSIIRGKNGNYKVLAVQEKPDKKRHQTITNVLVFLLEANSIACREMGDSPLSKNHIKKIRTVLKQGISVVDTSTLLAT